MQKTTEFYVCQKIDLRHFTDGGEDHKFPCTVDIYSTKAAADQAARDFTWRNPRRRAKVFVKSHV